MYAVEGRGLLSNEKNRRFSVSGNLGASIGYYTSVKGGLAARFGKLVSPSWSDYGPAQRLTAPSYLHQNNPSTIDDIEFYLFIMGGMDFVIYNAMLQGQFRDSRYEISNSDISRMVPHSSVGIVFGSKLPGRRRSIHFSFSYNWKGEEIMGDEGHVWNSISIGGSF